MNKVKNAASYILKNEPKKVKIIVALCLAGIILISMSEMFKSGDTESSAAESVTFDSEAYAEETEEKLKNIISSIEGVGECEVMITFSDTSESVFAQDSDSETDGDSQSSKDEYVIYDSSDGENPILIKEKYPAVSGVSVVCEGGGSVKVKESVINTVTALFNISSNRISVTKINK